MANLFTRAINKIAAELKENLGVGEKGFGDAGKRVNQVARSKPVSYAYNNVVKPTAQSIGRLGTAAGQAIAAPYVNRTIAGINSANKADVDFYMKRFKETGKLMYRDAAIKALNRTASGPDFEQVAGGDRGTVTNKEIASGALNLATLAVPGIKMPKVIAGANPAARLIGSGIVRGTEGAVPQFANDLINTGSLKESVKKVPKNVALGALINTALSPKLIGQTGKQVAQDFRDTSVRLPNGQVAFPGSVPVPGAPKERKFITSNKESPNIAPEVQGRIEGQYTPKSNKSLISQADADIQARGFDTAVNDAKSAVDLTDVGVAKSQILVQQLQKQGRYEDAAEVIMNNATNLTEAGRAVQAASLLNRMTPEGLQAIAARELSRKGQKITGEQTKTIKDLMEAANALPEGRERNLARQKAMEYVRNLTPSPLLDQMAAVWKAGLLTGFKTTGINTAGNTANFALERAKDPLAAVLDATASIFTGQRTKTATLGGIGSGAKKGISEGWDYLISGYDPRNVGSKMEERGVKFANNMLGKVAKGYSEAVFRFIGSQDRPFYYASMYNSLTDQALAAAKNAKVVGSTSRNAFVKKFIEDPPVEAAKRAALDAERAVFQNDTVLSKAGGAIQKIPGAQFIVPFSKTPSAVATQAINYTPIGIANSIVKNIGKGKFNQRELVEGVSRGITGTGAIAIGWELAKAGAINGAYPRSEKDRAIWEAEGRQSNRLVLGNQQIDLQALGPAGTAIAAGAAAYSAQKDGKDPVSAGVAGIANTLIESPFLQGASDVIDLAKDPINEGGKYIARQTGSIVPTLGSDIAQATDRDSEGRIRATKPEGAIEGIKNRVPGLRGTLAQKVDVFGNPLSTNKSTFQTMFDPLRSQGLVSTPVIDEFKRLGETTEGVDLTRLTEKQTIDGESVVLSPEDLRTLKSVVGQEIETNVTNIMQTRAYLEASDKERKKALDRIVTQAKDRGKELVASGQLSSIGSEQADISKLITQASTAQDTQPSAGRYQYNSIANPTVADARWAQDLARAKRDDVPVKDIQEMYKARIDDLTRYYDTLSPLNDEAEMIRTITQLEKLNVDLAKYQKQGGFTKGKKGRTIKVRSKLSAASRPKAIKAPKTVKITTVKRASVKPPKALKVTSGSQLKAPKRKSKKVVKVKR